MEEHTEDVARIARDIVYGQVSHKLLGYTFRRSLQQLHLFDTYDFPFASVSNM